MNEVLIAIALSTLVSNDVTVEMTTEPTLVYDMKLTYPRPELVQFAQRWGGWRYHDGYYSYPSRYSRPHYWGPYWRRDPYVQFHLWRGY